MQRYDFDMVIVGGGVSGVMAAGHAAERGCRVLLLEKKEKPLRKLRISGKGRGNLTNTRPLEEWSAKIFPDSHFLQPAFARFFNRDLVQFLNRIGVPTVEERGGRIFPASQRAWDVAEAMVRWAERSGATIECCANVTHIRTEKTHDGATVFNVNFELRDGNCSTKQYVKCPNLLLATGGVSYPATGSTGDGYRFAQQFGHTIVPVRPSLVPVEIVGFAQWRFNDVTLRNVRLTTFSDNKKTDEEFGELMLTPFGVSGPIVLRQSRSIVDAHRAGKKVVLQLDLKPALSEQQILNRIDREQQNVAVRSIGALLRKLMPAPLVAFFAAQVKKDVGAKITELDKINIAQSLKNTALHVHRPRPFTEAVVTAGGVSLRDINPETLQSRRLRGLYFAGELLDLDADTGGYNLQIAFSTGWLAGEVVNSE